MSEPAETTAIPGACFCRSVRFEVSLPTLACGHCHCSMCRRSHGAGFVTWVIVPSRQLNITAGSQSLVRHQSSDHGGRRFCGVCGSSLFGDSTRTPDLAYVVLANLEGAIDRVPEFHSCFPDRVAWIDVADDLERLDDAGVLTTTPE